MADATSRTTHETAPRAGTFAGPVANGVEVFQGQLASLEGGYINHWADGANDVFLGLLTGEGIGVDPYVQDDGDGTVGITGNTSASIPPEARVDTSGVTIKGLTVGGTPTQAKVGDPVYSADSSVSSITLDNTGRTHPIGYMSRYTSATDQDVTLFTPSEMLAQATA